MAKYIYQVSSPEEGYIAGITCDEIGICSLILGGGRETKESEIDLSVGLVLEQKKGAYVKKGDLLATFHANDEKKLQCAVERFLKAYTFSKEPVEKEKLIKGMI